MADPYNPTTPGVSVSPYPVDLQQEAASNSRRRAIADMLLARALSPVQQPTGPGGLPVPMSPFAALQPLAAGIVGAVAQGKADQGDKDIAARYSSGLAGAVSDMQTRMKAGDYAGASAVANRWPALGKISEKLFERQLPDVQASEGMLYDKNAPKPENSVVPLQTYSPTTETVTQPGGASVTIPGSKASVTGKVTMPPANILNVSNAPIIAGPKVGSEQYFKSAGEQVQKLGEAANNSVRLQGGLAQLKDLDKQGIFSNVSTGPATFITNLAQVAGLGVSPETQAKLGNTETFNAVAAEAWQRLVQEFGGNRGVTAQESETIKTILPKAASSPQARAQLYEILDRVASRNIQNYRIANQGYTKAIQEDKPEHWAAAMEKVFIPNTTPASPVPSGGGAAPISLDEYLRRQRGTQ